MSRTFDPTSLENFIGQATLDAHQQQQPNYPSMPSESHYHHSYMHSENTYFDQTHSITSQLSQISIDSLASIPNHRKSNFTDNSNVLINSKTPTATRPAEMNMGSVHNENLNTSFFVSEFIKEELVKRLSKSQEMPAEGSLLELPTRVDAYIDLIPIESLPGNNSFAFGMVSSVYRATNSDTGELCCLRRFHHFQPNTTNPKLLIGTIDSWKKIEHANLVKLRQVFTTKAFGDNSVIFVYDYHPSSETFMSCYFSNQLNSLNAHSSSIINGYSTSSRPYSQQNTRKYLPEQTIWNYIIQISSGLRTIHQANLAFRSLDPTKVLVTSGWSNSANNQFSNRGRSARVRLSFCGVQDILTLDTFLHCPSHRAIIHHFQLEDLVSFGKLCLALATNSLSAFNQENPQTDPLEAIPRVYSSDLKNLIASLLSCKPTNQGNKVRSIDEIMPMIGARFYMQLDNLYYKYDYLFDELTKEVDNGRLLRLLAKLGTINERSEHQLDPNWSETGDRYMLKLFRDYLFHQFDEEGRPWLDLGHIISNLNRFDAGSTEKICLVSRDAQNVLIVTFEELKRCFESAINELMQ